MQFSLRQTRLASAVLATMMLAACTTVPTGPSVHVMPGNGKTFEQFQADDGYCRQYAYNQNAGSAQGQQ